MTFSEDDLLPISGLQHLAYCERQAALIYVERVWVENIWTTEGAHLHEKVTSGDRESRGELRISRDLALRSLRLGLTGRADVVEFHRASKGASGACLAGASGLWQPLPVEYKRGRPKRHRADEIQLCAQALCLEEMLVVGIESGALFYGQTRRRLSVAFDGELRAITERAAFRLREIISTGTTPALPYKPARCDECSLLDACQPKTIGRDVGGYLRQAIGESIVDRRT
jgi:CRISPR-associated exonuclease Cas4